MSYYNRFTIDEPSFTIIEISYNHDLQTIYGRCELTITKFYSHDNGYAIVGLKNSL